MLLSDPFPVLETPRLRLVEIEASHSGALFAIFTNERVTRYYTVVPLHQEKDILPVIERFKAQYTERNGIRWGIMYGEGEGWFIGSIGFQYFKEGGRGSLVYALAPEYWGQGFIAEALPVVLRFGFEQLAFARIEAEVMPGNDASEKVLIRYGFHHEGLLEQWMLWRGKRYDINMFSITREGWQAR